MRSSRPSAARLRARQAAEVTSSQEAADLFRDAAEQRLRVRDVKTGALRSHDISWLGVVPALAPAIASAIVRYADRGTVSSHLTVKTFMNALRRGIVLFLVQTDRADIGLEQLDGATLTSLIGWLNLTEDGRARLNEITRLGYYNAALIMLELLRKDGGYRSQVLPPADVPVSPFRKRTAASIEPEALLGEGDLRAIFVACARSVRAISKEINADLALVDGPQPSDPVLAERWDVLRRVRSLVRGGTVSYNMIRDDDYFLAKRINALGRVNIMRSARPTLKDLVPFMVIFTIAFRLNSSVLLSAKRDDFDVRPWIGGDRVMARPFKARAGRRLAASTAVTTEAINPASMLGLLDRWLEPLRVLTGSDTLFQHWGGSSGAVVVDTRRMQKDHNINAELRSVAASVGVSANVTLNRLRAAVLDIAHLLSRGDLLKVKAAAGHSSIQTTGDHYVTAAGMAREDEALSLAMGSQARMIGTQGRFDPRRLDDEPTAACTPGWQCLRGSRPAFESTRTDGQCTAYGYCPVCPHGDIDRESPRACAQTHLLVDAIERAIEDMPPAAWRAQLAPIRMHLIETVLPSFDPSVHRRAAALELPSLPSPI